MASTVPAALPRPQFATSAQFLAEQIEIVETRGGDADRYLREIYRRWLDQPGSGGLLEREGHPFSRFLDDLRGLTHAWMTGWMSRTPLPDNPAEEGPAQAIDRDLVARGAAAVAAAAGGRP